MGLARRVARQTLKRSLANAAAFVLKRLSIDCMAPPPIMIKGAAFCATPLIAFKVGRLAPSASFVPLKTGGSC
jgi:hypothetical protein